MCPSHNLSCHWSSGNNRSVNPEQHQNRLPLQDHVEVDTRVGDEFRGITDRIVAEVEAPCRLGEPPSLVPDEDAAIRSACRPRMACSRGSIRR